MCSFSVKFYATSNLLSINIYLESQGILRSKLFYSIAKITLVSPSDRRSHDFKGFHKTFHFYNIIHKTDIDIDFHRYFTYIVVVSLICGKKPEKPTSLTPATNKHDHLKLYRVYLENGEIERTNQCLASILIICHVILWSSDLLA